MDHTVTRRGVVALAAAGLAGCLGSDDEQSDDPADTDDSADSDTDSDPESNGDDAGSLEPPERDIEPDWEAAAEFRTWLLADTVLDGNRRFDYTSVFPEGTELGAGFPDAVGLSTDTVDGHLIQSYTQVFFGTFDPEAVREAVSEDAETADDLEVVDDYEGYAVLEQSVGGDTRRLAVGPDAVVVGRDYERRIDAHRGEYERLEEADSEFTHLFRELPHDETITGHYGAPAAEGVDVDGVYLWGVSSESPTADELTWKFVFAREADLTEDALTSLEEISADVRESGIDGRTATVVGAPPSFS